MATTEDRTQSTSYFIGSGTKQYVGEMPRLKYFEGMKMMNDMMKMNGDLDDMGMNMSLNQMDMNVVMYPEITGEEKGKKAKDNGQPMEHHGENHKMNTDEDPNRYNANALSNIVTLNYAMLKSPHNTTLPKDAPVKELKFTLTGNMNRYVWSMDNKVLAESDKIPVKKGEILRITIHNNSMMRHPIHLHGFDFRVLNEHGENAPMKNIIDIMPMETDTIEFLANTEGDWFFHCHILYHMMAGMNRVFSYEQQAPNPYLPDKKWAYKKLQKESNEFHFMAENDFASNGNDGRAMLQNTRWSIGTEWRLGYHDDHGYESETHIGRYIGKNQWFMPFVGFDWRYRKTEGIAEKNIFGQGNTKDNRAVLSIGAEYTLPLLLTLQGEVFTDGYVRFQLMREDIPISPRLRWAFMINTDKEYMTGFKYIITRNLGISTHYDSDMGFGLGATINY